MSSDYWKGVLNTARERLIELRARRDELDAEREEVNLEIVQVEQVVTNLTPLVAEARQDMPRVSMLLGGLSLADACREVLKSTNKHMTPIEVRDALEASDYDLKQHNNALASIHGVLKRMADSGEVEPVTNDVRGTMYRWKGGGIRVPGSTGGGGIGSLRTGVAPESGKISVPPPPKVAKEDAGEGMRGLGDSLRKAAGLPPPPPPRRRGYTVPQYRVVDESKKKEE